ncbi:ABC transporter ATP-binding protein [Agromyces archimandritae]|uniref:ABC transporter ATP-binding protein n=1 Tax=Agromyces archimandritae TaxID=2781962 RepID=UPI003CC7D54F
MTISSLAKAYGDSTVFDGLDIEVEDGEFLTLLGPSGCGKTTTLRCVAGLEQPNEGRIDIGGDNVFDGTKNRFVQPQHRKIGMVFQNYALWPHLSVAQNVGYPLRMQRVRRSELRSRVEEALSLVSLADYAERPATALSGGQQQRVALARAIVSRPRVLLYDEPLSNLDAKLRGQMRNLLLRLHRLVPTTSVYVTHDQVEAITLSDRIVVMRDGAIEQIGTPREIYTRPANPFVADFLGFDNIVDAEVVDRGAGSGVRVRPSGSDAVFAVGGDGGPAGAERVTLAVRADRLLVDPRPERPGPAAVRATVGYVVYLGDELELGVRIGETRLTARISASALTGGLPVQGDEVWLTIAEEDIVVLPSE